MPPPRCCSLQDKNKDNREAAEAKFKDISEAYEVGSILGGVLIHTFSHNNCGIACQDKKPTARGRCLPHKETPAAAEAATHAYARAMLGMRQLLETPASQ
jgi:hypothetical protein